MARSRWRVGECSGQADRMLAVIETHPVQYHAPVYRAVEQEFGVRVTAIYGSDFSIAGHVDPEFGAEFSWDASLLEGYRSVFLARVTTGGARNDREVSARGLMKALNDVKPTALMLLGYSPAFYRAACFAGIWSGIPLFFRGETTDHAVSRSRWKTRARDVVLRALYRRCGRLLYVGDRSARHFERLGFQRSSLVFSPYCVDVSVFECDELARERLRTPTRQKLGISSDDFVVLFSGKLSERKGVDLLVDALKQLPASLRARIFLLVLGDGKLRAGLEAAVACEPRLRADFAGFRNQRELSPYFHASDVLVLPSRYGETWGLVVNDALHHGVPAICSDSVGCVPDLIETGKTGLTFGTDRGEELARAVEQVLAWQDNDAVRQACRSKVADYSVTRAAEGIARAYREIAR
jgi:glycosyltransferase involved in cell wall biosynthesis